MSRDIVVRFAGKRPNQNEVQLCLEDYVRGLASKVKWHKDRFVVDLPGAPSPAFRRVGPSTPAQRAMWREDDPRGRRWFEVWLGYGVVYVMTRMMDEVTNYIAYGFAVTLTHGWGGKVEDP
jgi:hypothetical protein